MKLQEPKHKARFSKQETDRTVTSKHIREKDAQTEEKTYLYAEPAIRERHGAIPIWLQLVAYGLIILGIYYTILYWSTG